MSLRRNELLVVPVLLGCWTLKPADEVPDAGAADVARPDDATDAASADGPRDVAPTDAGMDVARVDLGPPDAGMDVARVDLGPPDAGMDVARVDLGPPDAGMDVARVDLGPPDAGMDVARADVGMDVARGDAPDVVAPGDVPPTYPTDLRLIGPAGLSTVSDRQPRLSWSGAVSGLQLRVCLDRGCADPIYVALVNGTEHQVTAALAPGVYFWQLRRLDAGRAVTATWQLRVPNVSERRSGLPAGVSHRDMDNDGFVDIALGTPGPVAPTTAGGVQVHFGAESPMAMPGVMRQGPTGMSGLGYGWSLAWGDFNRDNLADLAVGVFDGASNPQGSVEVLYAELGRRFVAGPRLVAVGAVAPFYFPSSMTTGDLNGDGIDDLVVAAAGGSGQVQVHLGNALGLSATPSSVIVGPLGRPSAFGAAATVLGDVDGDGFGDLLVSDGCDPGMTVVDPPVCQPTAQGRVHIFFGRASWSMVDGPWVTLEGDPSGRLGRAVAPAGDLNRDGYADFVASGTTGVDEALTGVVHVYLGRARGQWSGVVRPAASLYGTSTSQMLGVSLAAADVNRDGYIDILAGAPGRETTAALYQGSAMVWLANASGGFLAPAARLPSNTLGALYGQIVTAPGDVNGDGFADVLVTAPMYPDRAVSRGQAYLWANQSSLFDRSVPSLTIQGSVPGGWLGRGATR